ncbi:unnamed protein product [Diamesa serratosioi]
MLMKCVTSANLKRNKRFLGSFWTDDNPISEAKKDFQTGITYSQLPPQYLPLLPGVNQHLIQNRVTLQQPIRYVQPQNRPIAPLPLPKQPLQTVAQQKPAQKIVMNQPIRMQPVAAIHQTAAPQFHQRGRDPQLPDIHKHNRFVQQKPAQRPIQIQPFSPRQQLPIQKKIFETVPSSVISIKNTELSNFYSTKEFQDLMKEFSIKADVNRLPDIKDVMGILGTNNAEDTLKTIREVANTKDGMELIKSFLEYNNDRTENDEFDFYEYEEDNRAGEIIVSDKVESFKIPAINNQQIKNLPVQGQQQQAIRYNYIPSSVLDERRALESTSGEATGSGASWWKPYTWFNSGISTKLDTLQKDAEILKNVLPQTESVWDRFNYVSHFFSPTPSRNSIPISPPFQVSIPGQSQQPQAVRLYSIQAPQTLPTLKMTEAEFAQFMGNLQNKHKPTPAPIGSPAIAPAQSFARQQYQFKDSIMVPSKPTFDQTQSLPEVPQQKQSFEESRDEIRLPQKYLEVPRESREPEIKRNFISSSEPQRATPYDFTATGRLGRANPEAVKALVTNDEEKTVIANISELTEQHQKDIEDESN